MPCTVSRKIVLGLVLVLSVIVSAAPAAAACLPNNTACGAPIQANDRLCCPGSICGPWGNVCQPGCRIGGVAYRAGNPNPANPCQVCTPAVSTTAWSNAATGTACSDNNSCTLNDRCQAGSCVPGSPVVCTALSVCHLAGVCNPATGVCTNPVNDGAPCTDGNLCTQTDACQGGSCIGTNPVVCPAPDQCHNLGTCNPGIGTCSNPIKYNGTACNDTNPCTQTDTCQGGSCVGGNPVNCDANPCTDPCHLSGTCDTATGLCVRPDAPNGTPCNDGDICNLDTCQAGTCTPAVPNPNFDHCANGVKDCDEIGVDCGGSCPACSCGPSCSTVSCEGSSDACGTGQGGRSCLCTQTTEAACFCIDRPLCPLPACTTSSDCAAGEQCIETCNGCSGQYKLCFPACGVLGPLRMSVGGSDPLQK